MTTAGTIRISGVTKTFRIYHRRETTLKEVILRRRRGVWEEFNALRDVSIAIEPGEAVGIIGRNGAGKSTSLKLLARILKPDRGTIEVQGRVSTLLELGAGFHPEYTAIENIYLSGAIYGMSRAELRPLVDEIIGFAELERFADNPVKTYSSGMFARLGFAIAVNVDPDVLLIDEVLAVGDKSFAARCFDRMYDFRRKRKTIVLVSHALGDVEAFCDRAIWIDEGVIREDGVPADVVRAYKDEVNAADEARSREELRSGANAAAARAPGIESQVRLIRMNLAGFDGEEREVFHGGEVVHISVRYEARGATSNPLCEIDLHRHDGLHIASASTRLAGLDIGLVEPGEAAFTWSIERMLLTPGQYYLTPRVYDETGHHVLDEQREWYRFRVVEGTFRDTAGAIVLPSAWSHQAQADVS